MQDAALQALSTQEKVKITSSLMSSLTRFTRLMFHILLWEDHIRDIDSLQLKIVSPYGIEKTAFGCQAPLGLCVHEKSRASFETREFDGTKNGRGKILVPRLSATDISAPIPSSDPNYAKRCRDLYQKETRDRLTVLLHNPDPDAPPAILTPGVDFFLLHTICFNPAKQALPNINPGRLQPATTPLDDDYYF